MKLQPQEVRVDRLVRRHRKDPAYRFDAVEDPRDPRGRRRPQQQLLHALLDGLLCNRSALRAVEALGQGRAEHGCPVERVPDTTLYDYLRKVEHLEGFRVALRRQVHGLYRAKSLRPEGLPCGVVSIDGKGIGTLDHDAGGSAQKAHRSHDGSPYWLPRVLRACLTSSPLRVCLDQMTVPPDTNEMGAFAAFWSALRQCYANNDLFEIVTVDAGLVSREHAELIHEANKAYVFALKGTQPELQREATRLLAPRLAGPAAACSPWEQAKGMQWRRSLYRSAEIAGFHHWHHLQQVWLVRTETRCADGSGPITLVEDRYFLSSVRPGRLSAAQILQVVRGHWGIENDCFGALDMQWREDDRPWCTQGHAVEVLGLLRLLAYNLLQLLRVRHLRPRRTDGKPAQPPTWRSVFESVRDALRLPPPRPSPSPASP